MTTYAIITFHTTHFSLKAKKVLEKRGIHFETIPVPREFSSDCGFCLKALWEEKDEVVNIMKEDNVKFDRIFRWERDEERERKRGFKFI
jgi:Putative Se/S carrier protein-like